MRAIRNCSYLAAGIGLVQPQGYIDSVTVTSRIDEAYAGATLPCKGEGKRGATCGSHLSIFCEHGRMFVPNFAKHPSRCMVLYVVNRN